MPPPAPTPHPPAMLYTLYLHKEKGSEPLPELHLCLTAEVPAGWDTGLDAAKNQAQQETPYPSPQPRVSGQGTDLDSGGDPLKGDRLPSLGLGSQDRAFAHHCCFSCFSVSCTTVKPQLQRRSEWNHLTAPRGLTAQVPRTEPRSMGQSWEQSSGPSQKGSIY